MRNKTYAARLNERPIIGGCLIPLASGTRVRIHTAGPYAQREYTADKGKTWHHTAMEALQVTREMGGPGSLDILGSDE